MNKKFLQQLKDKENINVYIISVILITVFSLLLGSHIYEENRVLYLDDLSAHQVFTNPDTTIMQKVLDIGLNKTRFVLNIVLLIFFKMVGNQYERVDILLQAENIFLGIAFYIIALIIEATYKKKDKKLTFIPLIVTLMFMASRFSYYSYTEVLGIMENIAMLCAILFVLFLLKDNFTLGKNYWIANFIYVIAIYTHERYFVLAGVLIVYLGMCWMMNKRKLSFSKKKLGFAFVWALVLPVAFFGVRFLFVGNRLLDGTGGTDITSTFSILVFLKYCLYQILYLAGINCPDDAYLNGVDPRSVPIMIYILEFGFLVVYIWNLVLFCRQKSAEKCKQIFKLLIFYLSIGASIICSSVTICIEMRWIYVSYALLLLSFVYLFANILTEYHTNILIFSILLSAIGILIGESYYRGCWNNLYYWKTRELSASLMETLGTEAHNIENLVVVEDPNSPGLDAETIKKICSNYDIEIENILKVANVHDCPSGGQVILKVADANEYTEISSYISDIYSISGWYVDGWIEPDTFIQIINQDSSELNMTLFYPYDILPTDDSHKISVYNNGLFVAEFTFTNEEKDFSLKIENLPLGANTLEILSDFYCIENSGRSEQGQLSCILTQIDIN